MNSLVMLESPGNSGAWASPEVVPCATLDGSLVLEWVTGRFSADTAAWTDKGVVLVRFLFF